MNSPFTEPHATSAALDSALDRSNSDVVLIVDDVPDNLSVLHDALDESGYTVLIATSGQAALQRAVQALPDVILLDAMMPGMDGFEVARRLKALPETAHIPIIFMTGLTETEYLVAALESGGVDYVTKPIKPKEVMARMGVHLAGARAAANAQCTGCLWLRHHHRACIGWLPAVANAIGARSAGGLLRHPRPANAAGSGRVAAGECEIGGAARGQHHRATQAQYRAGSQTINVSVASTNWR